MPLALLILGLMIMITAYRGNYAAVFTQLETDLTGAGSFFLWVFAILFLAIAGKVLNLPRATKLFIALIVCVYLVTNAGVLTNLESAFSNVSAVGGSSAVAATATNSGPGTAAISSAVGSALSSATGSTSVGGTAAGLTTSLTSIGGL